MTTNISVKQLAIITAVTALAVVGIWYVALFKPQTHKLASAHKADAAAKVQMTTLQDQVTSLRALEKDIPTDAVKLAQYQQAIPSAPELSNVIRLIQAAATHSGVAMGSLAPEVPTGVSATAGPSSVPGAHTIPVTIAATGSYQGLTSFVQALEAMPRTLVVKSIALGGTGTTMTESLAAEMYYTGI